VKKTHCPKKARADFDFSENGNKNVDGGGRPD
jgi:hypothetical protein